VPSGRTMAFSRCCNFRWARDCPPSGLGICEFAPLSDELRGRAEVTQSSSTSRFPKDSVERGSLVRSGRGAFKGPPRPVSLSAAAREFRRNTLLTTFGNLTQRRQSVGLGPSKLAWASRPTICSPRQDAEARPTSGNHWWRPADPGTSSSGVRLCRPSKPRPLSGRRDKAFIRWPSPKVCMKP